MNSYLLLTHLAIDEIVGQTELLALVWQLVKKKKNSEIKLAVLCLKIYFI